MNMIHIGKLDPKKVKRVMLLPLACRCSHQEFYIIDDKYVCVECSREYSMSELKGMYEN